MHKERGAVKSNMKGRNDQKKKKSSVTMAASAEREMNKQRTERQRKGPDVRAKRNHAGDD